MRYRTAHWWLAALLPLIVVAFWPGYFSDLRGASYARHVHGIAGTIWMALAGWQSWSATNRRLALHRTAGRAVFVAVPFFTAGAALAVVAMASSHVTGANPFNAAFGGRLALADATAMVAMPLLVRDALVHRRRMNRHAAAMLATVLLVLPPVLGRLFPLVPGLPSGFVPSFYAGQAVSIAIALALWARDRRDGIPFVWVAALLTLHCVFFAFYDGEGFARAAALLPRCPLPSPRRRRRSPCCGRRGGPRGGWRGSPRPAKRRGCRSISSAASFPSASRC